jgi:hypothetical protein
MNIGQSEGSHDKGRTFPFLWVDQLYPRALLQLQLQLIYDRQSVGQSVLVSGTHLGPVTNLSFSSKFPLDICVCVIL